MSNEEKRGAQSATPENQCKVIENFAYTQDVSLTDIVSGKVGKSTGILQVAPVNDWITKASLSPMPKALWNGLVYENEVTCLFSDTNTGKTILAVQIADEIARSGMNTLYVDFELSERQFARRYMDDEGTTYQFPPNFYRCEVAQYAKLTNFEIDAFYSIKESCLDYGIKFVVIDNLTWLNVNAEKGDEAAKLMQNLVSLKRDMSLTVLVVSHTPKRMLDKPITENDLGGSKRIANFIDASVAIGRSIKGTNIRYVKEVKQRNEAKKYDTNNVMVCEIVKGEDACTRFKQIGTSDEREHLTDKYEAKRRMTEEIMKLDSQGMSCREIANIVPYSKSSIQRIAKEHKVSQKVSQNAHGTVGSVGTTIQAKGDLKS